MNLAIRGIDGRIAHGDTLHSELQSDFNDDQILANPPNASFAGVD